MADISERLIVIDCWKCGILYGIGESFQKRRAADGKGFYCPRGHKAHYPRKEDPSEIHKRRIELLKLHEAEQAEARNADLARRDTALAAPTPPVQAAPVVRQDEAGRDVCPHCGKAYKLGWRLVEHMAKLHNMTEQQARALLCPFEQ